ncbi:MAG: glycosyltransferase family 4 protein [Chloroflexi bacterium]|nr:glycosyltransferase family 4 protein [Chloroflexota bacterium]
MLIGIDASRSVAQEPTGTESYSLNLIRHLLALPSDHRYRLYFNRPPSFPPKVGGEEGGAATLRPCDLRIVPFPRLWTHLRLSWEMARRPPDLLFVPAHVLPIVHPRCSVVTIHDLGYLYYPEAHRPLDRFYLDLSTRYNAHAATHLIADSSATRRDLVERYGSEPDKITVVYPGYDEATFRPVRDEEAIEAVKARYHIAGDYILFVGTLQPRKNLVRLIEAFANMQVGKHASGQVDANLQTCKLANLRLVIAGKKGWLYQEIFRLVEELGLEGKVVFTDYVPEGNLPALMSGARLFVFPSLYEGFGLPVLEAMACGIPVVCSNTSSLPEVAGDAAVLVDPLDVEGLAVAMERVLGDEELRAELIRRGFEQARKFSWETCARETLDVLESVCHEFH